MTVEFINNLPVDRYGRRRYAFPVEFDVRHQDQHNAVLMLHIAHQKRKRLTVIKDAVCLYTKLKNDDVDAFKTAFPDLYSEIYEAGRQAALEEFNLIVLNHTMEPNETSDKKATRKKSSDELPDDLESTLEVKTASKDEDNRSNFNFAISSALAVFGNGDSLPDEVIRYGLRTNRLQPRHITRKLKDAPIEPNKGSEMSQGSPSGNAKQLAGAEIEFAPPDFDDDELLALA